ncbi:glycosyltransferase [Psychroserpens sp.]|uniref:glycosyltransferase n=1 Tax=Psychroserpens sp. TaxID=2020870 RepID=UPI001B0FD79F|nr:glycosyltransferase [Psychroserpens sp.]MBO6606950.1 glycosyltransferase [Psychroserpens sp.]MBO6630830.1 glycosyltransferase [Psychroserpens sp.]MBO6654096.1 glycosyltransferase [Psychroserpens sp.]MBO6682618.1 glycosyltransferase [Psychroserpens sp.]MBO6750722.1 glycosyltransferase [Psychroserpens sp.]
MNSQPKVTVVIPNYNHEAYIVERIDSVLSQSYDHFEVFILDDCSTDNSLALIEKYESHPKVKDILVNPVNSGSLFKQWSKAINLASGDYLWIAESDDVAHKDFLQTTVEAIEKHPKSGLVFTDSIIIDEQGNYGNKVSETHKHLIAMNKAETTNIPSKSKVFEYLISNIIIWNASAVLFRTEIIKNINVEMLSTLNNAGDLYSYLNIALTNDMVYVNAPLNYFRQHDQNTTQNNIKSGALYKDRIRIISNLFTELLPLDNAKWHLQVFLSRHFITAIDHGLYSDASQIIKLYLDYNLINTSTFNSLSRYIWWSKQIKFVPHRYRNKVKKELVNSIEQ